MSFLASAISCAGRADRMADLELQVPQQVQDRFGGLFLVCIRRLRRQEHQVEVAERRHFAAPGAAEADERHAAGRLLDDPSAGKIPCQANDLIVEERRCQRSGAAIARLDGQAAGHLLAAARQRVGEDAGSLTGDLPAAAQRGQASATLRRSMIARGSWIDSGR